MLVTTWLTVIHTTTLYLYFSGAEEIVEGIKAKYPNLHDTIHVVPGCLEFDMRLVYERDVAESDDKLMEGIEAMYDFVDVEESPDESTQ